jgi:hypothetical protein
VAYKPIEDYGGQSANFFLRHMEEEDRAALLMPEGPGIDASYLCT